LPDRGDRDALLRDRLRRTVSAMQHSRASMARFSLALAAVVVSAAACGGTAHPKREPARSRATCEQLLRHSFELQEALATLALDDHRYQREQIHAALERRERELAAQPTFLDSCNALSDAEFACMSRSDNWFAYTSCYPQPKTSAGALTSAAITAEPGAAAAADAADAASAPDEHGGDVAPGGSAEPPPPPCPALASPGTGTGTVTGQVRRDDGGPTDSALVGLLRAGALEAVQDAIADERGAFVFKDVAPGVYDVTASSDSGFRIRRCVAVTGGAQVKVDLLVHVPLQPPSEIIELGGTKPKAKPRR
jgi:hypothetical protein